MPDTADQKSEQQLAIETPATWVNRFVINMTPGVTRIYFAEGMLPDVTPQARLAVVLPTSDAKELAEVLLGLAKTLAEGADQPPAKAN